MTDNGDMVITMTCEFNHLAQYLEGTKADENPEEQAHTDEMIGWVALAHGIFHAMMDTKEGSPLGPALITTAVETPERAAGVITALVTVLSKLETRQQAAADVLAQIPDEERERMRAAVRLTLDGR